MESLSKQEVRDNWAKRAMYIVWKDGSDSMCQDNDYAVDEILAAMDEGCEVFFDE